MSSAGHNGTSDRVFRLCVPPLASNAGTVRHALMEFGEKQGVDRHEMETLVFAVGEALANAVEHADATADIEVQCRIDDREIVATIIDGGRGVRKQLADDTIMPLPEPMAEGGRGIPIMQRCTDMFSIRPLPGGGTGVVLGLLRHFRKSA
jgi:anti-sigma regulatory factor (Ser/Thr protein kinase)